MPRLYRANRKKGTMGNSSNTDGGRERQDLCVRNRISTSGKTFYYKWSCGKRGGKIYLRGRKSKKKTVDLSMNCNHHSITKL